MRAKVEIAELLREQRNPVEVALLAAHLASEGRAYRCCELILWSFLFHKTLSLLPELLLLPLLLLQ